jgi:hypothetical protein
MSTTPRHVIGPYSPRRPSPLGFPPLAPHVAFQQPSYGWPHTPDRVVQPKGPSNMRVAYPSEARRPPLAGSTQRPKSQPPPPLKLENPPYPPLPKTGNALTVPGQEIEPSPPSLTPSEASSLSLYSHESAKDFPVEMLQEQEEEKSRNFFCSCFGLFSRRSREKDKETRILGPPIPKIVQPAPVPQMMQTGRMTQVGRRRPSPLNL